MPETNFSADRVYVQKGNDDNALVERALAGDLRAFGLLVDRYQKTVFNLALRMVHDVNDAEDIAQAVFIKIYEKLSSFDRRYRFFSWIYRIAMNETLNFLRQRKPTERVEELSLVASLQDDVERADTALQIDAAMKKLTADQQAVVVLRHFEGLAYGEIGTILNITEKKVKSRLFSARQILRDLLQRRGVSAA